MGMEPDAVYLHRKKEMSWRSPRKELLVHILRRGAAELRDTSCSGQGAARRSTRTRTHSLTSALHGDAETSSHPTTVEAAYRCNAR
jgi:hypothetical protein